MAAYLTVLQKGLTRGIVRTLLRVDSSVALNYYGIYCMAASINTHNTGGLYALQVEIGTSSNVQIRKASSSGALGVGGAGSQLGSSVSAQFNTNGDIVALELFWDADNQIEFGGTKLTAKLGTATDYSDLSTVIDVVDTTSPFTSSVAEGIFSQHQSGSSNSVFYDETIIQLVS